MLHVLCMLSKKGHTPYVDTQHILAAVAERPTHQESLPLLAHHGAPPGMSSGPSSVWIQGAPLPYTQHHSTSSTRIAHLYHRQYLWGNACALDPLLTDTWCMSNCDWMGSTKYMERAAYCSSRLALLLPSSCIWLACAWAVCCHCTDLRRGSCLVARRASPLAQLCSGRSPYPHVRQGLRIQTGQGK
jgi:hypothetical protein